MVSRSWKKWSVATLVFGILSTLLPAQRLHVINRSVADGLSQSEVSDIVEQKDGRIVFNTGGLGVDVFDGRRFEPYRDFPGLGSAFINTLFVDREGVTWFVNLRGMVPMDADSTQAMTFGEAGKGISNVFSTVQTGEDDYLIGTDDGLIWIEDGVARPRIGSGREMKVFGILAVSRTEALLATQRGLKTWTDGDYRPYFDASVPFRETAMYSIERDLAGTLYLGTSNGLISVTAEGLLEFIDLDLRAGNTVISLLATTDGRLLAGTNGSGLYILQNGEVLDHITEARGLSDDYVWSLMESRNGDFWIGTSGAGVDVISSPQFSQLTTQEGLSGDVVYAFSEDEDHRLWIGLVQGGITVVDGEEMRYLGVDDGLSHRTVRCLLQEDDTLWIGTENGLSIYHHDRLQDVSDLFGLRNQAIFDIHRAADGTIWFACKGERYFGPNGGAAQWDGQRLRTYQTNDGLIDDNVYFIHEEEDGEMWFGTASGISIWNGSEFSMPMNDGLCGGTAICLRKDRWGSRWVGTIGGLSTIDEKGTTCLAEGTDVKARTVYFLEIQGDSILWIGSSEGLEKLDLEQYHANGELSVTHYDDRTGFIGTEANQNAVLKYSDGSIWFGTIEGAVRYDPEQDPGPRVLGQTSILSFTVNGEELETRMIPKSGPLTYGHRQNNVAVEYDIIDPVAASNYLFSIRLEGLEDGEWSPYSDQRSVIYTNLAPSDYSFSVRAMSTTTGEKTAEKSVDFEIVPAIWQRTWFRLLASFLLTVLVVGLFLWRLRQVKARQKEQQEFQRQLYEVEMTALRAQMNPHFLFNSLNSVNHFIIKHERAEASAYLTKFARLVRLVLLNSEKKTVSLENELEALRLYIDMESLRFEGAFETELDIDPDLDLTAFQIPPLLLQPYVENAIWHGLLHLEERKGRLTISLSGKADRLHIRIEDNGVGRERAKELKSRSATKNKSMGMKINADRMRLTEELYGYKTIVKVTDSMDESGKGIGTLVQLELIYHDKDHTYGDRGR